jgi:hypothetical protein
MHARVKQLNPHANIPAAVKMNEINPKYENTRKIHRLLTNQNPGFLYQEEIIFVQTFLKWIVLYRLSMDLFILVCTDKLQ